MHNIFYWLSSGSKNLSVKWRYDTKMSKGKGVPGHTMKAYSENKGMISLFLTSRNRRKWKVNITGRFIRGEELSVPND